MIVYAVPTESTSPRFCKAFAQGCGGTVSDENKLQPGDVALWGSPQLWPLLDQAIAEGRTWYYGDHAFFGRGTYFRIAKNTYQYDPYGDAPGDRFAAQKIPIRPWRTKGKHIVLCPQSTSYMAHFGQTFWENEVRATLANYTDRPIRVRTKSTPHPLADDLVDAWACINYTSVCGMQAALEGVASFATAPCVSQRFGSGDLSLIENPVRPDDREQMCRVLAYNQWSLAEISAGMAWRVLQ